MNIGFSSYVFLRTPTLSYVDYTPTLESIIKSDFFQLAIFFASESLYAELKRYDFNYHILDKKLKVSLQKYFNRMCHRPTPFGMFSAFTSLYWGDPINSQLGVHLLDDQLYVSPDFQLLIDIAAEIEKMDVFDNLIYYTNNSIYSIKNDRRYLTRKPGIKEEKNIFIISSFEYDGLVNKTLNYCKSGKTKSQIVAWLNELIGCSDGIEDYIHDLIHSGLLISELTPNISGKKYFDRLIDIIANENHRSIFCNQLLEYKTFIDKIRNYNDVNIKALLHSDINLTFARQLKSKFYVGYEKKTESIVDLKFQGYIKDGLYCLDRLTNNNEPSSLLDFKKKFTSRFEDQEVSLLVALDREAGISYDGLEWSLNSSSLLNGIYLNKSSPDVNFNWTPVHEFFLSKLYQINNGQKIIINEKDLEKINCKSHLKSPPSFSVLYRIFGDKIWIEQVGGSSAISLLGRFTQFNAQILAEAHAINLKEQTLNPNVVFAEISCYNDEHTSNITSNAGIRKYEIPIGVHSTLKREYVINLSDIVISVVQNQIVLRSKKLNKIIIPRLSSAYNYTRSDLSVYRFLCDLQYQGIKNNYNIDLKSLLPGLSFYPRVEFKNCIIFPATWVLKTEDITELCNEFEITANTGILTKKLNLKRHFALAEGDNHLYFDCNDEQSVQMFMQIISKKTSATLQESFVENETFVRNIENKPVCGQFIASVISQDITYNCDVIESPAKKYSAKRAYLPGDEWIYFKLYTHSSVSNDILRRNIWRFISELRKQKILKCWYFIRYFDTDSHLRIRMRSDKNNVALIIQFFEKNIRNNFDKGSLNNLLLDTYKREIERYGAATIEHVENIFEASSDLVVNFIKNNKIGKTSYSDIDFALASTRMMLEVLLDSNTAKILLLESIHKGMKYEFEDSKLVRLQLDAKYREYTEFINNLAYDKNKVTENINRKGLVKYTRTLETLKLNTRSLSAERFYKMVADLMHMHLNRVFIEEQRKQEFVIYYLLYKHYVSAEARKSKMAKLFSAASQSLGIDHLNKTILK